MLRILGCGGARDRGRYNDACDFRTREPFVRLSGSNV